MDKTDERNTDQFIMDPISTPNEIGPGRYERYATFHRQHIEKPTHMTKYHSFSNPQTLNATGSFEIPRPGFNQTSHRYDIKQQKSGFQTFNPGPGKYDLPPSKI